MTSELHADPTSIGKQLKQMRFEDGETLDSNKLLRDFLLGATQIGDEKQIQVVLVFLAARLNVYLCSQEPLIQMTGCRLSAAALSTRDEMLTHRSAELLHMVEDSLIKGIFLHTHTHTHLPSGGISIHLHGDFSVHASMNLTSDLPTLNESLLISFYYTITV